MVLVRLVEGTGEQGERGIRIALRAVIAFKCPRPPLKDITKEIGVGQGTSKREPSNTGEGAGGFRQVSRFLRSQPRRIGLGLPLGRDPSRKIVYRRSAPVEDKLTAKPPRWHPAAARHRRSAPCAPPPTAVPSWRVCSPCAECLWWLDKGLVLPCRQTAARSPRLL